MTNKTLRNINQSNQSWARPGDRNLFSETTFIDQSANKQTEKFGKTLSKGGKLILGGSAQPRVGDSVAKPGVLCSTLCPSQACVGDNKPFQEVI